MPVQGDPLPGKSYGVGPRAARRYVVGKAQAVRFAAVFTVFTALPALPAAVVEPVDGIGHLLHVARGLGGHAELKRPALHAALVAETDLLAACRTRAFAEIVSQEQGIGAARGACQVVSQRACRAGGEVDAHAARPLAIGAVCGPRALPDCACQLLEAQIARELREVHELALGGAASARVPKPHGAIGGLHDLLQRAFATLLREHLLAQRVKSGLHLRELAQIHRRKRVEPLAFRLVARLVRG